MGPGRAGPNYLQMTDGAFNGIFAKKNIFLVFLHLYYDLIIDFFFAFFFEIQNLNIRVSDKVDIVYRISFEVEAVTNTRALHTIAFFIFIFGRLQEKSGIIGKCTK